ncbi:BrnA antitoxin family protein [Glaciimonas sp. PAMC28666]|uniref:BrnA antitoxin family protein n=1 Tax=Glaciimonas sp. PAMC28666 TaxID=2807626 RepID=UPI001962B94C|nr:BrnA antitoxin family protein [Glaciimonas sp. PAMC28666]QRX82292.1 BrnA antitoxin family protein [Glaciimonas sp. PAMC28666]
MSTDKNPTKLELHVIVFAGPNGSGKTSLIDEIKVSGLKTVGGVYPLPVRFINPDQVSKDLQGDFVDQNARDWAAARAAVQMRAEATTSQQPFAFETVMSHPSRINELLMLKEEGYKVLLTFITTDDPEKNVARVNLRYETGSTTGHYVPSEKVRERYSRTLALLPRAAEIADAVFIYDNSADFEKARLQVVIEKDAQFSIASDPKEWVYQQLINPLQQRDNEFNDMTALLAERGYALGETDELRGTYQGSVLHVSTYFLAQFDTVLQQAVIHDRLMLDTAQDVLPIYTEKKNLTIRYSLRDAPVVKERLTISLSVDILTQFRATGDDWQTRMDAALRDWLKDHALTH